MSRGEPDRADMLSRLAQFWPRFRVILIITTFIVVVQTRGLELLASANIPVGLNSPVAGYGHLKEDVVTDASLPLQNANHHLHITVLPLYAFLGDGGLSIDTENPPWTLYSLLH